MPLLTSLVISNIILFSYFSNEICHFGVNCISQYKCNLLPTFSTHHSHPTINLSPHIIYARKQPPLMICAIGPYHNESYLRAFIKPDRKLPRLFADAGTWFRNETLVSAASATKRKRADGRVLSGGHPSKSVPTEGFCPADVQAKACRRKGSVRRMSGNLFYNLLKLSNFGILVFSFSMRAFSLGSSFL